MPDFKGLVLNMGGAHNIFFVCFLHVSHHPCLFVYIFQLNGWQGYITACWKCQLPTSQAEQEAATLIAVVNSTAKCFSYSRRFGSTVCAH